MVSFAICCTILIVLLAFRDPLVIFDGSVEEIDDMKFTEHFENIQSTNWQTVRWKPPPRREHEDSPRIGWRCRMSQACLLRIPVRSCLLRLDKVSRIPFRRGVYTRPRQQIFQARRPRPHQVRQTRRWGVACCADLTIYRYIGLATFLLSLEDLRNHLSTSQVMSRVMMVEIQPKFKRRNVVANSRSNRVSVIPA